MRIIQLTDIHIVPKGEAWMDNPLAKVDERLERVVEEINHLSPAPDVVLLTGDTIDRGGKESYAYLKELLSPLSLPVYIIPGNHDDREEMRQAFFEKGYMPAQGPIRYVIDDYPLRLIGLDTLIPGKDYGALSQAQLYWVEDKLKENPTKPTLLFMHHFPVQVGQKCFDSAPLESDGDFEKLIATFPNIVGVIAGHYHKACVTLYGGKPFFIAPSVAPVHYFADADHMHISGIDMTMPSFVLHHWQNGKLVSECNQVVPADDRVKETIRKP